MTCFSKFSFVTRKKKATSSVNLQHGKESVYACINLLGAIENQTDYPSLYPVLIVVITRPKVVVIRLFLLLC